MADEAKIKIAQPVYYTLCAMMDEKKYHYKKFDEDLTVTITMNGDDIPMDFVITIDAERSLVRLLSRIPATFKEEMREIGAIAACQANYRLADGSFDFDYETGKVTFRMTSCFRESYISKDVFDYMLSVACYTVDEYNDQFLALSKGYFPLESFLNKQ